MSKGLDAFAAMPQRDFPHSVKRADLTAALRSFYELIGFNEMDIYDEPGITITRGRVMVVVTPRSLVDPRFEGRPPGTRALVRFKSDDAADVLEYSVVVPIEVTEDE